MKINLGAADRHIEGYLCIDQAPPPCAECGDIDGRTVDLNSAWPWWNSCDEILAYDVCEHLNSRIHFMNSAWHALKNGGRITIETPDASRGVGFWQDCTHVTGWCLSSFKYFELGAFAHGRLAKAYGIVAAFKVVSLNSNRVGTGEDPREEVFKIRAVLEAVKP